MSTVSKYHKKERKEPHRGCLSCAVSVTKLHHYTSCTQKCSPCHSTKTACTNVALATALHDTMGKTKVSMILTANNTPHS